MLSTRLVSFVAPQAGQPAIQQTGLSALPRQPGRRQLLDAPSGPRRLRRQTEIGFGHNPVGVGFHWRIVTQGSSFLATLGFGTESRWDS